MNIFLPAGVALKPIAQAENSPCESHGAKRAMMRVLSYILLTAGLALCACGLGEDSHATAEAFCHRYFVEMDQAHALELASGLAAEKLRKEIDLLKGAARAFDGGEREFHQLKPFTDFVMLDRDPKTDENAERVLYIYEIRIESRQDTSKMKRAFVINTVKEEGRWIVSNFDLEAR